MNGSRSAFALSTAHMSSKNMAVKAQTGHFRHHSKEWCGSRQAEWQLEQTLIDLLYLGVTLCQ